MRLWVLLQLKLKAMVRLCKWIVRVFTVHTFIAMLHVIAGTTLTQQIVYLIMTLDFEKAVNVDLDDRFPFADLKDSAYPYFR